MRDVLKLKGLSKNCPPEEDYDWNRGSTEGGALMERHTRGMEEQRISDIDYKEEGRIRKELIELIVDNGSHDGSIFVVETLGYSNQLVVLLLTCS